MAAVAAIDLWGLLDSDLPGDYTQVGLRATTGCSLSARSPIPPNIFFKICFADLHQYKG